MSDDEGALVLLPVGQRISDESHHNNEEIKKNHSSTLTVVAAITAALGGLLFGYDIGIIASALPQVTQEFSLSINQEEAVVSLMLAGALFASLAGGSLIDKVGSRIAIMVNAVVFIVGALVLATAQSFLFLLLGRFIVGFAVALSAVSECIYISEIATPRNRGMLVSLNEVAITLGFLVAYVIGLIFDEDPKGWRYMFGLSVVPALAQLLGMTKLPNSPHYLVTKQRNAEAESAVSRLRQLDCPDAIRQELTHIRLSLEEPTSCSNLCSDAGLRAGLIISMGLVLSQQFTGQSNVLNYASTILHQVGFCSGSLPNVGLGIVKLVATIVSLLVIDRLGRRVTLLSGSAVMALALIYLSIFASIQDVTTTTMPSCSNDTEPLGGDPLRITALAALMSYVAAYSFSFGPVTWLLLAELFPPSVKGRAVSVSTSLNWAANLIISATFLRTIQLMTLGGVFAFYSAMTVSSAVFIFFAVPETSGRTLFRISKDLRTTSFRQRAIQHFYGIFPRRVRNPVSTTRYDQLLSL